MSAVKNIACLVLLLAAALPGRVLGGDELASGNLMVDVDVASACSILINNNNIAFPEYDGTDVRAEALIRLSCSAGSSYTVGLTQGEVDLPGNRAMRNLGDDTKQLAYDLTMDMEGMDRWTTTETWTGTGAGIVESRTVYGHLFGSQRQATGGPEPGEYMDTVEVILEF